MNGKLWILIDGRTSGVNSVLAGEALKRAAEREGITADVEVRGPEGAAKPFASQPAAGDRLLVLGKIEPPLPWAGLPKTASSLEEALSDPPALIARIEGNIPAAKDSQKTILSSIGGWFKK